MIYCNKLDDGSILIEQVDTVTGSVDNEWLLTGEGKEAAAALMLYALIDEDEILIEDDIVGEMFEAAIEDDEDIVFEDCDEDEDDDCCCCCCCEDCGAPLSDPEEERVSDEESHLYAELAAFLFKAIFGD